MGSWAPWRLCALCPSTAMGAEGPQQRGLWEETPREHSRHPPCHVSEDWGMMEQEAGTPSPMAGSAGAVTGGAGRGCRTRHVRAASAETRLSPRPAARLHACPVISQRHRQDRPGAGALRTEVASRVSRGAAAGLLGHPGGCRPRGTGQAGCSLPRVSRAAPAVLFIG